MTHSYCLCNLIVKYVGSLTQHLSYGHSSYRCNLITPYRILLFQIYFEYHTFRIFAQTSLYTISKWTFRLYSGQAPPHLRISHSQVYTQDLRCFTATKLKRVFRTSKHTVISSPLWASQLTTLAHYYRSNGYCYNLLRHLYHKYIVAHTPLRLPCTVSVPIPPTWIVHFNTIISMTH